MKTSHEADAELFGQKASWRRMLQARPARNVATTIHRHDDRELRITVRKRKPAYLVPPLTWAIRPKLQRTIVLDPLGIEIWDLCDANRTVENIIDEFSDRHKLTFHEARVAVTEHLKTLVQRGALAVVEQEPAQNQHENDLSGKK